MNRCSKVASSLILVIATAACSGNGVTADAAPVMPTAAASEPTYRYADAAPGTYLATSGRARLFPFETERELVNKADLVVLGTVIDEQYNEAYGPPDLRLQTRNMTIAVEQLIAGSPAGDPRQVRLLDEPGRQVGSNKPLIGEDEARVEVGDRAIFTLVKFPDQDAYQMRIGQGALLLGGGHVVDTPRSDKLVRRLEAATEAEALRMLKAAKS